MGRRVVVLALAFFLVLVVTASVGVRKRRIEKAYAEVTSVERVDMGIRLVVVRKPADGTKVGNPPAPEHVVRVHALGGMIQLGGIPDEWDVATMGDPPPAFLVGPSDNPREWLCSEAQESLILHPDDAPVWALIQGSEGAGKTVTLAMWSALRVLEHVGERVEAAITAPTSPRLGKVKKEIARLWDPRWFRWSERDQTYYFHAGPSILMQSAVQRSEAAGSPIQGDSWEWCGSDELQDHFEREADIISRGRGAKAGRYKRLCTSTSKDSTLWRNFRTGCQSSPDWSFTKMLGLHSPFVDDAHWNRYRRASNISPREWARRVMAEDVGPERQVYFNWRRKFDSGKPANLRALPVGAIDVTAEVLAPWGRNLAVLVGHDPGQRQHVSVFLKAYRFRDQRDARPRWFVVDEVTTPEVTVEAHARAVLARLRDPEKGWGCHLLDRRGQPDPDSPAALVRIDPHTRGGTAHPGQDVYTIWRRLGLFARAAAYHGSTPSVIKRTSRIDMVNTLLCAVAEVGEVRRLFVLVDEHGLPAAPKLVEAFESMERNEAGEAETERKDADDLSHWPAALGYALWQVESPNVRMAQEAA